MSLPQPAPAAQVRSWSGGRRDQVRADASLCGGNSAASEQRGMAREIQFIIDPGDRFKDDPAVL